MSRPLSRRALLGGLAAFGLGQSALAQSTLAPLTSLRPTGRGTDLLKAYQPPLSELVAASGLPGKVSVQVADVNTGLVLESHNPLRALPPASVAKALTACYALDVLGPGYHFETRLLASGPVENGRLDGDLILAGGGDPTLDTDALADMAKRLREEAGITEVMGRFLIWDGALPLVREIDPEQPVQVGYNPGISGLNLNFNRVHFEWKRAGEGYSVTMDARSESLRPDVRTARMRIEPRRFPIYTYADAGTHDAWTVAQGALGKQGARWLPVRKPALYAAEVFQTLARSNGIVLKTGEKIDAIPEGTTPLVTHQSAPLRIILRDMLRYSTNITAECVGMTATNARAGSVTTLKGSAEAMNAWAVETLGMSAPALEDHSGLGDDSRLSARDMVKALIAARKAMGIKPLLRTHPLRTEEREIIKDHPMKVQAKTGTLNFVSGLGGFIDLPDGTELAFAFFSADLPSRDALSREERERPPGGKTYNTRARKLQQRMLARWGIVYNS
ncbi:D-alanyl-D-alanine carboxypeptidase/D-alanyl-D-alanine endopeptidase [Marivita hallyeonensis]|uniref:D-alanyl-D-alanine carboxypeptidase / D-alanyl-D-alanine-endopeptidase (Penicillin-binding protein 4) n=1 Tax=Marivita hallyeonensis TaxID=996342 RepID=A0A1M5NLD9_9RHOB|nr:D-alanyl-D-alanine carboxypeptidase/D-alanyl-D-alanine-endopeptidase [Marivita hallyeonensis]SHG90009.1 D-alanyl-D-alanine carboxypeptidase / D-alanyl-D-alanine-endopeptidase (penicillin-binding protein 4) [Marivita hallyeonensis]